MAVMSGNRVGGNWLTKWDKLKFPWYTLRLMYRKRVTCELHDDQTCHSKDRVGDRVGVELMGLFINPENPVLFFVKE